MWPSEQNRDPLRDIVSQVSYSICNAANLRGALVNSASKFHAAPLHNTLRAEIAPATEIDQLIAEFSIAQHDGHYWLHGYRYEQLEDAVSYAKMIRARYAHTMKRSLAPDSL